MSPSSNSVYSSVFTYNPYVLIRPYRHLTFMALIGPHWIMCVSHLIVAFQLWDLETVYECVWMPLDTLTNCLKLTYRPSTKVSWLFDKLSVACLSLVSTLHHSATLQTFYCKNIWNWIIRLLQNYKYSLYPCHCLNSLNSLL